MGMGSRRGGVAKRRGMVGRAVAEGLEGRVMLAVAPDADRTFTHPAENGSGDNVHNLTLNPDTYTFRVDPEPDGYHWVYWYSSYSGTGGLLRSEWLNWRDDIDRTFTPGTYTLRAELYSCDFWGDKQSWEAVYRWSVTVNSAPTLPGVPYASSVARASATINWTSSTDSDGDPITYDLRYGDPIWGSWTTLSNVAKPCTITGLSSGSNYVVQAWANDNKGGSSGWTSSGSFTTATNHAPSQPGTITAPTVDTSGATINWGAATDADGDPITYEVQYGWTYYIDGWTSAGFTPGTTMAITGLLPDSTYTIRVYARDGKGGESCRDASGLFKTQAATVTKLSFCDASGNVITSINDGQPVYLRADAVGMNGQQINVSIYEDDGTFGNDDRIVTKQLTIGANGSDTAEWVASWQGDDGIAPFNRYYLYYDVPWSLSDVYSGRGVTRLPLCCGMVL